MNKICDFCDKQGQGNQSGVACGEASNSRSDDGYGPFKMGCSCIYDSDLKDYFVPRNKENISIKNLVSSTDGLIKERSELKEKIRILSNRLTSVDGAK